MQPVGSSFHGRAPGCHRYYRDFDWATLPAVQAAREAADEAMQQQPQATRACSTQHA